MTNPTDEQIATVLRGNGEVTVPLEMAGQRYEIVFTRTEIQVHSECCASQPSLEEARRIYQAWGVWLQLQDEHDG